MKAFSGMFNTPGGGNVARTWRVRQAIVGHWRAFSEYTEDILTLAPVGGSRI